MDSLTTTDGSHSVDPVIVGPLSVKGAIEWSSIKSRPRSAFWTICLYVIGDKRFRASARPSEIWPRDQGFLVPALTVRKTPGWVIVTPQFPKRTLLAICNRSIAPLLRLGLLDAEVEGTEAQLKISDTGAATWEQFELRGGRWAKDVV
jgi:hypothetical protein